MAWFERSLIHGRLWGDGFAIKDEVGGAALISHSGYHTIGDT